ncbi:MAG TPA: glutathione peroxidase [Candidatus Hydrogenedentes bacterium]|nr:glutathione peroxidase [Candidatus Hydrogenedentota bacterium]
MNLAIPLAAVMTFACATALAADKAESKKESALDFSVKDIDGRDVSLSTYKGKVAMIVNVASKCGNTPQYEQLEALHEKYSGKGLAILGFPANNFKSQEPGTNEEIKAFCTLKYNVKFDMFAKISVKGEDIAPLYHFLTATEHNGEFGGEIQWNFTKFLLNRKGEVVARFEPKTKPDDPEVIKAIEAALAEKE